MHITLVFTGDNAAHPASGPLQTDLPLPDEGPLSRALWMSGVLKSQPLCSGLGRCGRCRVRFMDRPPEQVPAETDILGEEAVLAGYRLACRHDLADLTDPAASAGHQASIRLELPASMRKLPSGTLSPVQMSASGQDDRADRTPSRDDTGGRAGLAVDVGTTSVCWSLISPDGQDSDQMKAEGSFINPQMACGSDVISRLACADDPSLRHALSEQIRDALRGLVADCETTCHTRIERMVVTANTAMTELLLDHPTDNLAHAPYFLRYRGSSTETLDGLPPVVIPPLVAPFVGSDIVCGLHDLLAQKTEPPFLLADLGTNTEFCFLPDAHTLFFASVPMGPAMEGIGMACGQMAEAGVSTAFRLTPDGLTSQTPDRRTPQAGISATGYISLLAVLLRSGIMDSSGRFVQETSLPFMRKILDRVTRYRGRARLLLENGLFLDACDVEEMLKVRAAFATAVGALLRLAPDRGSVRLCLAGALGRHVSVDDLVTLGFIPGNLAENVLTVGNAALRGAERLLRTPQDLSGLAAFCENSVVLSLTDDPHFQETFVNMMHFGSYRW